MSTFPLYHGRRCRTHRARSPAAMSSGWPSRHRAHTLGASRGSDRCPTDRDARDSRPEFRAQLRRSRPVEGVVNGNPVTVTPIVPPPSTRVHAAATGFPGSPKRRLRGDPIGIAVVLIRRVRQTRSERSRSESVAGGSAFRSDPAPAVDERGAERARPRDGPGDDRLGDGIPGIGRRVEPGGRRHDRRPARRLAVEDVADPRRAVTLRSPSGSFVQSRTPDDVRAAGRAYTVADWCPRSAGRGGARQGRGGSAAPAGAATDDGREDRALERVPEKLHAASLASRRCAAAVRPM